MSITLDISQIQCSSFNTKLLKHTLQLLFDDEFRRSECKGDEERDSIPTQSYFFVCVGPLNLIIHPIDPIIGQVVYRNNDPLAAHLM